MITLKFVGIGNERNAGKGQENTNKFVYDSNKKKLKYHSHFLVLSKEERANKWKMTNKKAKENFGL